MHILHFFQSQNNLQSQYVSMLMSTMGTGVEQAAYNSISDVRKALNGSHFDILHIHGCWSVQYAKAAALARRLGTRVIITPHGELEPWILKDRQWQEKMPKTLLYQRQTIQEAYVVIAMGNMEYKSLERLAWNPRIETVRNALVTHSITPQDMTRQLLAIYRKVMDSDVYHLMDDNTRQTLFTILKAGVCGDVRWLDNLTSNTPLGRRTLATEGTQEQPTPDTQSWRQILIYVRQEQLDNIFERGLQLLRNNIQHPAPSTQIDNVDYYLPTGYKPSKTITAAIGNSFVSENERLLTTFKYLHRLHTTHRLSMLHLLELEREIREHDIDEELLYETLQENRLLVFASRLMGALAHFTRMEEGMMPVPPINDRQTERLMEIVTNHLTI